MLYAQIIQFYTLGFILNQYQQQILQLIITGIKNSVLSLTLLNDREFSFFEPTLLTF
jgi:hypothetical protein